MIKKICIISLSTIARDSRVLRQIEYLHRNYIVHAIGFGGCPNEYTSSKNVIWHQIYRPKTAAARNLYTIFNRFILIPFFPRTHPAYKIASKIHFDVYHANNWDSLPIAALAARHQNSKLVVDIHESYNCWYWGLITPLVKYIFRKYAKDIDASSTVVRQLVEQHKEFGIDPIVIKNIPMLPETQIELNKTDPSRIRLVYHGVASPSRSTDLLIQVIAKCNDRFELHLALTNFDSKYVKKLRSLADKIAPGRVFFHPPYKPYEIVNRISIYDVGFYPLPPKSYNLSISLPNKLFEFIAAGLAVVIGPSASMAEIVKEYNCGKVARSFSAEDLAELLNRTTPEEWDQMKAASLTASQTLNAEIEMQKIMDIYSDLFK